MEPRFFFKGDAALVKREMEWVSEETADEVAGLLSGTIDPDLYDCVKEMTANGWGGYPVLDKVLHAVDHLIEGFGVEAIREEGKCDSYFGDSVGLYVNMGDAYTPSVYYDTDTGEIMVTDQESFMEARDARLAAADAEDQDS